MFLLHSSASSRQVPARARRRPASRGFTLTELIVVTMVGSFFFALAFRVLSSVTSQGTRMDRRTTGWHTYCRFTDQLRFDLQQTIHIRTPNPRTLELETRSLGQDFRQVSSTIVWRQRDDHTIVRTESGADHVFDFSGALDRGRVIALDFGLAP